MTSVAPAAGPGALAAHLLFLAAIAGAAGAALAAALSALVRPSAAGTLTRLASAASAVLASGAVVIAAGVAPPLPQSAFGPDAATIAAFSALALGASSCVVSWSAAEPRVAALLSAASALAAQGVLLQLLLYAAAPDRAAAASWELRRFSTTAAAAGLLASLVALLGYALSLRPKALARALHALAGTGGLAAAAFALSLTGGATLRDAAPVLLVVVAAFAWLSWLALRERPASTRLSLPASVRRAASTLRRLPERPAAVLAFSIVPLGVAALALAFASGDTARDAARVDLGGLAFTPALLVPFAVAPALGLLLGCARLRARGLFAMGLALLVTGLLFAQKEIGYTGVVVGAAALAFLTSRGALLPLALAGAGALAALGLAFELQPVLPQIPFTVRERLLLWLGTAGFLRRGGHLLAADRVTYDLGGLYGLGVGTRPDLDLHATVNSLDTDFPLAVVGLYGGLPWILAWLGVFLAFSLLLLDVARRQARRGGPATSGWRLPTLSGLAAIPIASTAINVSGGLTHLAPFAGVPAPFASYGSFFWAGLAGSLALFAVLGSDEALAASLRARAAAALPAPAPAAGPAAAPVRRLPPEPWWRHPTLAGVRLALRRAAGRLRRISPDAGALLAALALVLLGGSWARAVHTRYTDRPRVHALPDLVTPLRVRPLVPGVFEVEGPAPPGWAGLLRDGEVRRLDALELRYEAGRLELTGACFPRAPEGGPPIRVGFEGLAAPRLTGFAGAGSAFASRLGAALPPPNDLVLPLAPVWLRHLEVTRIGPSLLRVAAATPGARFVLHDETGQQVSPPRGGAAEVPAGWTVALAADDRLHLRLDAAAGDPEVCLRAARRPFVSLALDRGRDTLVGGLDLLRRAPVGETVDFEFAEDLKRAAEGGIVRLGAGGRLEVTPWDAASREGWDPKTRSRFRRVFRVRTSDTGAERLHWVRGFYRDGSSEVRFDADPEAFAEGFFGELLGLRDPFRFRMALPDSATAAAPPEPGRVLDRKGRTLAREVDGGARWETDLPGGGALLGWGFPRQGVFGGLLRTFRHLLAGRPVVTGGADEELAERILGRTTSRIGVDVLLTLDRDVQSAVAEVVHDECEALRRMALDVGDLAWRPHGRALVLGPEGEVLAAAQCPDLDASTLAEVVDVVRRQKEEPNEAPGLDAWHRTTTVGSTVKVGLVVAAARKAEEHFAPYGEDDLCIRAEDDPANAQKGCFRERGSLPSFRGEAIEPVMNYGGQYFGGVVTVRELLRRSINTASSYLAGRLGREGIREFWSLLEMDRPYDLLPDVLGKDPHFAPDLDRHPGDALLARRARIGELPPGPDTWRTTYDVRLGLSGFTDLSLLHVAVATGIAARDGRHFRPFLVRGFRDLADARTTLAEAPHPLQVVPVRVARHLKEAMVETVRRGTAASLRRMVPKAIWEEAGGKTGTGETTKPEPGSPDEPEGGRRKPRTQDHKLFAGFWPASSRSPYVVVCAFEHASHLDTRVAIRAFGRIVERLGAP